MRRLITRSIIVGVCLLFALALTIGLFFGSKQPKRKGELIITGLHQDVEVIFDKWAVPHIHAQNESDAYFSLGYLHAQDRLFQMEMLRRLAKGELAEIFGEEALKFDKFFRTLGIRSIGEKLFAKLDRQSPAYHALEAYLAGLNSYVTKGPTPIEFQILGIPKSSFEPVDTFCIAGYMAQSFVKAIQVDSFVDFVREKLGAQFIADIAPNAEKQVVGSLPFEPLQGLADLGHSFATFHQSLGSSFDGSNAWAISGKRTRSGKPILANDPHIGFSAPSVWFEAYLETPDFSIYGHHIAGVPVALLGHNEKHGWGLTMLQNDGMDFYREKTNPENPNQVWFRDHWEDLKIHTETIRVKGKADVSVEIKASRHGPFINEVIPEFKEQTQPIAVWWDFADDENDMLGSFYDLAHAQNISQAEQAVSRIHSPGFNVMYANASGDIAWWTAARFPIRPKHTLGKYILDGASGLDEFEGFYPFSSHPSRVNPASGFIVSANQDPFGNHPYQVPGYYNPAYRYDLIKERLEAKASDWTIEDIKNVQLETTNPIYRRITTRLLAVLAPQVSQTLALDASARTLLEHWNFQHSIESLPATVFHEFLGQLVLTIFHDRLPHTFYNALLQSNLIHDALVRLMENPQSPWWQDKNGVARQKEIVTEAWNKTLISLEAALGADTQKWQWGKVHTVEHKHVLGRSKLLSWLVNVGPIAAMGSVEVVNNHYFWVSPGQHEVRTGPSTRRIIDFVNPKESWGINPTGQAGYFANAHYRDQAPLYHQGEYRLQIMNAKTLEKPRRLFLRAAARSEESVSSI